MTVETDVSETNGKNAVAFSRVLRRSLFIFLIATLCIWLIYFASWAIIISGIQDDDVFQEINNRYISRTISINLIAIGVLLGVHLLLRYQQIRNPTAIDYSAYGWWFFMGLFLTTAVFCIFLKTNLIVVGFGEVTKDGGFLLNNFDKDLLSALIVGIVSGAASDNIVKMIIKTIGKMSDTENTP